MSSSVEYFPLSAVGLEKGVFHDAQQRDLEYILAHEVDRFLAPFHEEAGLQARAGSYPNWESSGLDGHVGGHYLTALAQMWAATGNAEVQGRLEYMIDELARCQAAIGTGYVGGVRGGRDLWAELAAGKVEADPFSLNGRWVPWYNLHKTFAGLRDAWQIAGNKQAGKVLVGLSQWCLELLESMTDEEIHAMLRTEHGGMNEVLADVYALTGDLRYLEAARKFSDRRILDPLLEEEDLLTGMHANTQIPKVIGYARIAELAGSETWMEASRFFWDRVVYHRSAAIGGNSVSEHFNPVGDFSSMIEHQQGPETCNTYNMLKLTERLFSTAPDGRLVDYYERALYNHILSSQHPERGGFVYFTPLRPRHYRVYSQPGKCFWCCVGSGMENHGKYGRFIYAHSGEDNLYVNLFIPSRLEWTGKNLTIHQESGFPREDCSRLTFEMSRPTSFALRIRRPAWCPENRFHVEVNGHPVKDLLFENGYLVIRRDWRNGDQVQVRFQKSLRLEGLPDGSPYAAFTYGPLVLAACVAEEELTGLIADEGRMAHSPDGPQWPLEKAPALRGPPQEILGSLRSYPDNPLAFILGVDEQEYLLRPFHEVHDCRYMIYWKIEAATNPG